MCICESRVLLRLCHYFSQSLNLPLLHIIYYCKQEAHRTDLVIPLWGALSNTLKYAL